MPCPAPRSWIAFAFVVAACGDGGRTSGAWDPSETASDDPTIPDDEGSSASPLTSSEGADDDAPPPVPLDSTGTESTGAPSYDCTPWATQWIGGPCTSDAECSYDGGTCLREDEGFPCGTCSQPCDELCPDLDGAPETFCIDGADVGLQSAGWCVSQCDPGILGGNGCRDGYVCAALSRYQDPGTSTGVCVPVGNADPMTDCQQQLVDRGVAFVPTTHELDHPDGHPELDCVIVDPVLLYGPIDGVALLDGNYEDNPVLVGCETAIAIVDTAEIAAGMDPPATQMLHYGTYSCRVIAGTSSLSNHAEGRAIDLAAFVIDGEEISLFADWEDGVANPVTPSGQWLRDFADALWDTMTWHIILTPEYNDAHDDHFHVDLTPGESFYE